MTSDSFNAMKAVIRSKYGPPQVLRVIETNVPKPKNDELLIKVHATTVNRTDCAVVTGKPLIIRLFTGVFHPRLPVPGTDFAGEVIAVGKDVKNFKNGDRVWGFDDNGLSSQAEYVTVSTKKAVSLLPAGVSYQQAAASAEAAHYAYHCITKVQLKAGQRALLNGATGGIGSALLQILSYYDVRVTAVCGTEHLSLVKSLGADRVIDYMKEDFTEDNEQYDFVFDAVGKSTFFKCKKLLKTNGIYISSELGPWCQNVLLALLTPFLPGKKVKFPLPIDIGASMKFIKGLTEQGKFKPVIDRTYTLEQIRDAYTYVASGQKIGNVILVLNDEQTP